MKITYDTPEIKKSVRLAFRVDHGIGELTGEVRKTISGLNGVEYEFDWSMINHTWDLLDYSDQTELAAKILEASKERLDNLI